MGISGIVDGARVEARRLIIREMMVAQTGTKGSKESRMTERVLLWAAGWMRRFTETGKD